MWRVGYQRGNACRILSKAVHRLHLAPTGKARQSFYGKSICTGTFRIAVAFLRSREGEVVTRAWQ